MFTVSKTVVKQAIIIARHPKHSPKVCFKFITKLSSRRRNRIEFYNPGLLHCCDGGISAEL
jgi:hypothetical protein